MSGVILSVTEVRNALRCPRAFALGRLHQKVVAFPIGASALGAAFHRIVDSFARESADPPAFVRALPLGAPTETVGRAVGRWILDLAAAEIARHPAYAEMPAEVDDLAEALREFAHYCAKRIDASKSTPASTLATFLAASETPVEAVIDADSWEGVVVSGRIDALHAPPHGGIEVVEYKLTQDENEDVDRAQVALYRALLSRTDRASAVPVILRFNPTLTITELATQTADALVASKLVPLLRVMPTWITNPAGAPPPRRVDLCGACPVRAACIETFAAPLACRDEPPAGAARPRPSPSGEPSTAAPDRALRPGAAPQEPDGEGEQLRARVLDVLRKLGVPAPVAKPPVVGARVVQIELSVERGRVAVLDRAARDLEHRLASSDGRRAQLVEREGLRFVTIERRQPRTVRLADLLAKRAEWLQARPGRLVLGEAVDGEVVGVDLSEPTACHLLVGGATGSGKSVLLRAIATSLAQFQPPSAIRFTLIDPKRVSFAALAAGLSAHLACAPCHDVQEAIPVLSDLVDEMEERYRILETARVQDVTELDETRPTSERLPRHVVLVDEFQDLVVDKETREPFLETIRRLGAKARAAGIHLVLATQRPTKEAVPGSIKANLPGKVALRTTSQLESRVILDQNGAESLLGKGDLLADLGHGIVRAQAPL